MTKQHKNKINQLPVKIKSQKDSITIATGGTGGHIFPAEALCHQLKNDGYNVILIHDSRAKEFLGPGFAEVEKLEIFSTNFSGNIVKKFTDLFLITLSLFKIWRFFKKHNTKMVIGFGSYISFPSILVAKFMGLTIYIHEQNSVLGRVNKLFLSVADKLFTSFPDTIGIKEKYRLKVFYTGNPVRAKINDIKGTNKTRYKTNSVNERKTIKKDQFVLLVIGGSQGSKVLGRIIPLTINRLHKDIKSKLKKVKIYHQVRKESLEEIKELYKKDSEHVTSIDVNSFYTNIAELMLDADLIICRAGASTISELTTLGKPSILIPYAAAKDNHQLHNALFLKKHHASIVIEENDFTVDALHEIIFRLINNPDELKDMSKNASLIAKNDAVNNIIKLM